MINPTQEQDVAINQDGLSVLSACPGSGKTFTVAHRIKRIINNKKLLPYQGIAALSFTNIAKDSIIKEYEEISGKKLGGPHFVGTIDSFLNKVIFNPFSHRVIGDGKKEIKILDVHSEWLNVVYAQAAQYNLNPQNITINIKGEVVYQGSKLPNPRRQKYIEWLKNDLLSKCLVTQGDVNFFCYKILNKYEHVKNALIMRYPFIIIDEAQDCSAVQMGLVDLLASSGHSEIMLVGDAYQAIYEWRDADPLLFVNKENDGNWQKRELLFNQRSGEEICKFLNRFHDNRVIKQHPARVELNDAEVKIINMNDREALCKKFLEDVQRKGISIDKDKVAILYGGHLSKINFKSLNINPFNIWKDSDGVLRNARKVYALPLLCKIALLKKDYEEAYSCIEKFLYFYIEKNHKGSASDIKGHFLDKIETRIILWDLCKNLPPLNMGIDDWIARTNILIAETIIILGLNGSIEIKKTRGLQNPNLQQELFGSTSPMKHINNITLENIHQIKGRTFDAVMVFIDSGSGNYKLSISKISKILKHKDLLTGEHHEDGRCFYVAASRARRLLWIAATDDKIQNAF